jgi:hypothetical protein
LGWNQSNHWHFSAFFLELPNPTRVPKPDINFRLTEMKEATMAGAAINWDVAVAGIKKIEEKFGHSSTTTQQPDPAHPTNTPNLAQANTRGPSKG